MRRTTVDADLLRKCGSPSEDWSDIDAELLVTAWGRLAPWVLADSVLEAAARSAESHGNSMHAATLRQSPRIRGHECAFAILLVNRDKNRYPLIRESFALPFYWESSEQPFPSSADVPMPLQKLAADVVKTMRREQQLAPHWRLRLAVDSFSDSYSLRNWNDLAFESAWAILAMALWTTQSKGKMPRNLVATAAWDNGLKSVEGVPEKIREAKRIGAEFVYVTEENRAQLTPELLPESIHVLPLTNVLPQPIAAIRDALAHSLTEPPIPSTDSPTEWDMFFHEAHAHRNRLNQLNDRKTSDRYYTETVLPVAAEKCRATHHLDELTKPISLIVILSKGSGLLELIVRVLRPVRCLVLVTDDTTKDWPNVLLRLQRELPECQFETENWKPSLERLQAFRDQQPTHLLVGDLTSGTKRMTLEMSEWNQRLGFRGIYIETDFVDKQAKAGTERLHWFPALG
ncbi:hypothetical protein [Tuwongella immobilis]|uniref:Uncharacterized protein n=1 Tax=Tuwongella immobilis TaxID=692036 RepID=A0A6C2YLS7_9BACT|nr:hypothetical protein [Tuwongella immobilis]VIP02317.1 unnamed protein product [Tuwongella immobilis]VTS01037.1 unnamed protein product [Tuwongella immobilis]